MVEHRACILACEVEVGMVGKIHDSVGITHSLKVGTKLAGVVPRVFHRHLHVSGIVLVAIGAYESEHHSVTFELAVPNLVLEALRSAMQSIRAIVDGKLILLSAHCKLSLSYTVGIASRHFAGARTVVEIVGSISISKHHISHIALCIRHDSRNDAGAES